MDAETAWAGMCEVRLARPIPCGILFRLPMVFQRFHMGWINRFLPLSCSSLSMYSLRLGSLSLNGLGKRRMEGGTFTQFQKPQHSYGRLGR